MKKLLIYIGLFILLSLTAFADTECNQNENCTLYAKFTINGVEHSIDNANISIINNTGDVIKSDVMTPDGIGKFIYISTYNNTGDYLVNVKFINNSEIIGTASENLKVNEGMTELVLVLLLLGITFIGFYAYKNIKTDEVPEGRVPEKMIWYTLGVVGVLFLGFLGINIGGKSSVGYMNIPSTVLYTVIIVIVGAVLYFYFVYLIEMWFKFRKVREDNDG